MITGAIQGLGWVTSGGVGRGREQRTCTLASGPLPRLSGRQVFPDGHPHFGRLDGFSRLGLSALAFALQDAGLATWQEKRPIGIVAATEHGCLQTDADYYDTVIPEDGSLASPNLFAYTLPNCFMGEAALQYGLTGPTCVLNYRAADPLCVLRTALEELRWNALAGILAGIVNAAGSIVDAQPRHLPPGAIFFHLAPEPAVAPYGTLSLTRDGDLHHNGMPAKTLTRLLAAALAAHHEHRDPTP